MEELLLWPHKHLCPLLGVTILEALCTNLSLLLNGPDTTIDL